MEELFQKFNEGQGEAIPKSAAPTGQVPVVGGPGGQAPGPTIAPAIDKNTKDQFEKMTPEEIAALDLQTLSSIVRAVASKEITLSDEQRVALFAAIKAKGGGRADAQ